LPGMMVLPRGASSQKAMAKLGAAICRSRAPSAAHPNDLDQLVAY
jgi:hypothetical protein